MPVSKFWFQTAEQNVDDRILFSLSKKKRFWL